jgi:predicted TIM-barrel fold metal-dependent hydrolase
MRAPIGFAPRWLAQEIDHRGLGADRVLFASDEPWGDHAGELARLQAAAAGRELSDAVFRTNFNTLYA